MGPAELDPEMVPQFPGPGTPRHPMRKGSNTPEGKEEKGDQFYHPCQSVKPTWVHGHFDIH